MKLSFTLLGLLLSIATISAAESGTACAAASTLATLLPEAVFAPAAAPSPTDSLPAGRHKLSSYRNGSSIEVVVEDRAIKSLKIDGKEVPASEYDQHQDRVEELMGTSENGGRSDHGMHLYRWNDENQQEGMEERFEGMGEHFEKMGESFELRFENMGEHFEKMGERLGESFERLFDGEGNGNVMRFEFRGDENGRWRMDSLGEGPHIQWHSEGMDPKGLNPDMSASERSRTEAEIREMETMIERMERRKERMEEDLERQQRDLERQGQDLERQQRELERQGRDVEREGRDTDREADRQLREMEREEVRKDRTEGRAANYEVIVEQLQREGLIEDTGKLRKLSVDGESLKVNGKKASQEGYARFLELYEQQTGKAFGSKTSISIKNN